MPSPIKPIKHPGHSPLVVFFTTLFATLYIALFATIANVQAQAQAQAYNQTLSIEGNITIAHAPISIEGDANFVVLPGFNYTRPVHIHWAVPSEALKGIEAKEARVRVIVSTQTPYLFFREDGVLLKGVNFELVCVIESLNESYACSNASRLSKNLTLLASVPQNASPTRAVINVNAQILFAAQAAQTAQTATSTPQALQSTPIVSPIAGALKNERGERGERGGISFDIFRISTYDAITIASLIVALIALALAALALKKRH